MLDVNQLSEKGCLRPGWTSTCQWVNGNEVFSINLRAEAERVRLSYAVRVEPASPRSTRKDQGGMGMISPSGIERTRGAKYHLHRPSALSVRRHSRLFHLPWT
jgi:hypothetical protein